jgi:hypothetical protein
LVDTGINDPGLENPYRAMSVAAVERAGPVEFVEWLTSTDGRTSIERASREIFERTDVYLPPPAEAP